MNKFGRFLGRISAETCLKIDYFVVNPPKIAKLGVRPFRLNILHFYPPPSVQKTAKKSRATATNMHVQIRFTLKLKEVVGLPIFIAKCNKLINSQKFNQIRNQVVNTTQPGAWPAYLTEKLKSLERVGQS